MVPGKDIEQQVSRLFRPDLVEDLQSDRFDQEMGWRPDVYFKNTVPPEVHEDFELRSSINLDNGLMDVSRIGKFGREVIMSSRYEDRFIPKDKE